MLNNSSLIPERCQRCRLKHAKNGAESEKERKKINKWNWKVASSERAFLRYAQKTPGMFTVSWRFPFLLVVLLLVTRSPGRMRGWRRLNKTARKRWTIWKGEKNEKKREIHLFLIKKRWNLFCFCLAFIHFITLHSTAANPPPSPPHPSPRRFHSLIYEKH